MCAATVDVVISAPQKQRAQPVFDCVGNGKP
jgi:hypothetical protein